MKAKGILRHLSKAIRPIEVRSNFTDFSFRNDDRFTSRFQADYRRWETGRAEPIRHDGGYVFIEIIDTNGPTDSLSYGSS